MESENTRHKYVLDKHHTVARIYMVVIITHQNVMPHMMRPKYKEVFFG